MSELVLWPDPRLRESCEEVPKGMDVREIVSTMLEVLAKERGMGIAAPQIGEMLRIIVCMNRVMINPTIKQASDQMRWVSEGCLSFPETCPKYDKNGNVFREGRTIRVHRHKIISMRAYDHYWKPITVKGRDWMGACMQHELDHLNGVTLDDHRKQ